VGVVRKGKFKLKRKELIDSQGMILQESLISIDENRQPRDLNIFLSDDLVCPLSEKKTNAGNKIRIIGILKEIPIFLKSGGQSTKFDFIFHANNFETIEETYTEIEISNEDKKK